MDTRLDDLLGEITGAHLSDRNEEEVIADIKRLYQEARFNAHLAGQAHAGAEPSFSPARNYIENHFNPGT